MASKQLVNNLSKLGLPRQNWMSPLASVRHSSCRGDIEKVTHTGQVREIGTVDPIILRLRKHFVEYVRKYLNLYIFQVFDKEDYRNARFVNAKRYVNENWGIKLIEEVPPKECTERVIFCDGGDGPLGHPKVYINLVRS